MISSVFLADEVVVLAVDGRDDAARLGRTTPMMVLISVLLPLPLVPSKRTVSRAPTFNDTLWRTRTDP